MRRRLSKGYGRYTDSGIPLLKEVQLAMKPLTVYFVGGDWNGDVMMSSNNSKITAVRAARNTIANYNNELNCPGIYMLFLGQGNVYVGQTNGECLYRVFASHTNSIERDWQSALVFPCAAPNISKNELEYLENALCEIAHKRFTCTTQRPKRENCNSNYRDNQNQYHLDFLKRSTRQQYIKDIEFYINQFPSVFPQNSSAVTCDSPVTEPAQCNDTAQRQTQTALFYYSSTRTGAHGCIETEIHLGASRPKRKTILKKGAVISPAVSTAPTFSGSSKVVQQRRERIASGKLIERVLQVDEFSFESPNEALAFLSGQSLSAPKELKTADGIKFKDLE